MRYPERRRLGLAAAVLPLAAVAATLTMLGVPRVVVGAGVVVFLAWLSWRLGQ